MKVSLFIEGCYPYLVGGVSSWAHAFIKNMPDIEFCLHTIVVDKKQMGKFAYKLPKNVTSVNEIALYDDDEVFKDRKIKLTKADRQALSTLLMGERSSDWNGIFSLFRKNPDLSINKLLMGADFLEAITSYYEQKYSHVVFSDFLWTMRSLFLPLFHLLKWRPQKADLYHSFCTGYAGIMASYAKNTFPETPLIITEHGIYTREREEEIIKTDWAKGVYKDIWISNFYKQSSCAYSQADRVVALYEKASRLQIEMGCEAEKTLVIPNGVDVLSHDNIPQKDKDDTFINIGAVVRITPIKDIKTMLSAYYHAKQNVSNLRLFIIGPQDEDPEYYSECIKLTENLGISDVVFTGRVIVKEYIGKMDMLLLTSISESQPLVLLEAMSARKPCIATNVGCCADILNGTEQDNLGAAGIITPIMQIDAIANAIVKLALDEGLRQKMGEIGRSRVIRYYRQEQLYEAYTKLYAQLLPKLPDKFENILEPKIYEKEVLVWRA